MSEDTETPIFVVSLDVSDPPEFPSDVAQMLEGARVVLLGTYVTSDQASPEQAREEFGDDAEQVLDGWEQRFREIGQVVETRLVFTPDRSETLQRVDEELEFDAIVIPRPVQSIRNVLVALSRDADFERVQACAAQLLQSEELRVKLLSMQEEDDEEERSELLLKGLRERLVELGVDDAYIEVESASSDDPIAATSEVAEDFDLLILAEREERIVDSLFGRTWDLVADSFGGPAVVVKS